MSILTSPRAPVKASRRPLNVRLTLEIRGVAYSVEPIAPGPDNTKAYRLVKQAGEGECYDVAHSNDGLVVCDCPAYVASHEGTASTCKHGSALVLVGLLPKPCHVASVKAPAPVTGNAPVTGSDRWASLAEALEVAGLPPVAGGAPEEKPEPTPAERWKITRDESDAISAVIEKRASWLANHKPEPRKLVLLEEDGTPLPDLEELDLSRKAENERRIRQLMSEGRELILEREDDAKALQAVKELRADWVIDAPKDEPCCPEGEIPCHPCSREIEITSLPADADAIPGVEDEHLANHAAIPLADLVENEAACYRARGDAFCTMLADQLARLAQMIRLADATDPADVADRLEILEAEARDTWFAAGVEDGRRLALMEEVGA